MSELPKGWDYQEVGSFNNHKGKNIKPSDFPDEVFEVFSVPTFASGKPEYLKGSDIGSSKQVVRSGDVLVCKINPRINRVWVVPTKGNYRQIASSEWINVRNEEFDSRYLKYAFTSQSFRDLICSEVTGVGGSLTRAQPKKVAGYKIPVAPIHEQKRIADKLDSVLAKVEAAQARLDKIPAILKRFRQSVLAAATSGELTKNMMVDDRDYFFKLSTVIDEAKANSKKMPLSQAEIDEAKRNFNVDVWEGWQLFALENLVEPNRGIPYGIVQTGEPHEGGIPTVRCGDVQPLHINETSLKHVSPSVEEKYKRTRLNGGEVLLAIRGTVGNAAVVSDSLARRNANISREVAMIPLLSNVSAEYIALLLQSPGGALSLGQKVRGVAQKGINLADVKRFVTPLPTYDEQVLIVNKVNELMQQAAQADFQYQAANLKLKKLTQSILARAFKGELLTNPVESEITEIESSIEALNA